MNVGVGAWQSEGPKIREHLTRLCEAHSIDEATLEGLRGHRLPLRRPGTPIAAERALLVGDAAGLIDPVSGDGMYECFVSSRLATAAILDLLAGRASSLEPYGTRRRHGADAAAQRVVAAQAGARPLAARVVAGRPHGAPVAQHRTAADRRAGASRPATRPGPSPAASAVSPRPLPVAPDGAAAPTDPSRGDERRELPVPGTGVRTVTIVCPL